MAEETTALAETLATDTDELIDLIRGFRVSGESAVGDLGDDLVGGLDLVGDPLQRLACLADQT
ncbi:hypothetical protein AB9E26_36410, partial [Rhizobium leguminosarum]